MNYTTLRNQDYATYCKKTWFFQRYNPRRFRDVHRACIEVLATKENPSRAISKAHDIVTATKPVQADWLDFLIEAVLEALGVPDGVQRDMLRACGRIALNERGTGSYPVNRHVAGPRTFGAFALYWFVALFFCASDEGST